MSSTRAPHKSGTGSNYTDLAHN